MQGLAQGSSLITVNLGDDWELSMVVECGPKVLLVVAH